MNGGGGPRTGMRPETLEKLRAEPVKAGGPVFTLEMLDALRAPDGTDYACPVCGNVAREHVTNNAVIIGWLWTGAEWIHRTCTSWERFDG